MTVILSSKGFKLPRLEREKFVNLMHLGLAYDRNTQLFSIEAYDNIEQVLAALGDIFGGEEVVFNQRCVKCSKYFACKSCSYVEVCTSKNLPFSCVCPQCLREGKASENMQANL